MIGETNETITVELVDDLVAVLEIETQLQPPDEGDGVRPSVRINGDSRTKGIPQQGGNMITAASIARHAAAIAAALA